MKWSKKLIDNFEGYCCVFTLSAMSIIIFVQVIFRYLLKASLPWSEELSRYLLVWTTFFGGAYGVRLGAHIGVEAFMMLLPKKVKRVLNVLILIVSIALCAIIFIFSIQIVQTQLRKGQLSPAMRIQMGYVYLAIPFGMGLFIIRYVQNLIIEVRQLIPVLIVKGGDK